MRAVSLSCGSFRMDEVAMSTSFCDADISIDHIQSVEQQPRVPHSSRPFERACPERKPKGGLSNRTQRIPDQPPTFFIAFFITFFITMSSDRRHRHAQSPCPKMKTG